ncbi:unnamed protein product [Linum trigynum]|uniref:Uncharacterized protein n=1 Tax=Linum trigynum TaxID=586398 RepID=A0AAV2DUB6_9ROSI
MESERRMLGRGFWWWRDSGMEAEARLGRGFWWWRGGRRQADWGSGVGMGSGDEEWRRDWRGGGDGKWDWEMRNVSGKKREGSGLAGFRNGGGSSPQQRVLVVAGRPSPGRLGVAESGV